MGNCLCIKNSDSVESNLSSEEHKIKGNQLFSRGKFSEAIQCYKTCIKINPNNPIYYSNNAICFFKLKQYENCYQSAILAVKIDKNNVKGLILAIKSKISLGLLNFSLEDWQKAFQLSSNLENLESQSKEYGKWLREKIESAGEVVKLGQKRKRLQSYYEEVLHPAKYAEVQKWLKKRDLKMTALQCPVGLEIFDEPIVISSGNTYDQKIVNDLIRSRNLVDPLTRERFREDIIFYNLAVRKAILWFMRKTSDPLDCFN